MYVRKRLNLTKKKSYKLYKIKWVDAASDGGWLPLSKIEPRRLEIESIGWEVHTSKEYIILAQSLSSIGNCADRIEIPKKWILKRKEIRGHTIEYK